MRCIVLAALVGLSAPLVAHAETCSAGYAQCGGNGQNGYTGPTCCVDGFTCIYVNEYYSHCMPGTAAPTPKPTATTTSAPTSSPAPTATQKPAATVYLTYDTDKVAEHSHAAYPSNAKCNALPLDDCMSGTVWGETTTVATNESWHYSRSTHYGTTEAGACGFGLYAMCTKGSKDSKWADAMLGGLCDAFCKAYPVLCQDPKDVSLRGNFAAPDGKYYTQFWPHLAGDRDNYLSCGECFEVVRTKPDGTDYQPGEAGYTDPIVLEITDSCPCDANDKWCCGWGDDKCDEVKNFKYGCPIPVGSTHLDLSDIAMGRLQGNGTLTAGVVPTRNRRVPCPKPGNIYIWLRDGGGPYWFALTVVNTAGVGGVTKVEIKGAGDSTWTAMEHDPSYMLDRPQMRYGSWSIPQGKGPFKVPIAMRITSPNGEQAVNMQAIKTFDAPSTAVPKYNYIDFGIQFSADGKH